MFARTAAEVVLADRGDMGGTVAKILGERERVFRGLAAIPGIVPIPSSANFILFGLEGRSASGFYARLRGRGVLVRVFDDPLLARHLRVTIGRARRERRVPRGRPGDRRRRPPMRALLFDMDGVLVDVSASYRRAVRETVRRFSGSGIGDRAIQDYKDRGGLNNDWDLTLAALMDRGVVVGREEVVTAFQEAYAGRDFDGLIRNERWLVDLAVLEELSASFRVGIVTGRPEAETLHTLRRFKARSCFSVVVTMDDLPPGRGKPDPRGIRLALSRVGADEGYYVGIGGRHAGGAGGGPRPDGRRAAGGPERPGQEARLLAAGAARIVPDINRIREALE